MLEALKIFLLLTYFVQLYLIAESFLVALISVPLFACIEIHERTDAPMRKKIFVWLMGVLIPMLIFFYFSFTPTHWNPEKTLTAIGVQSALFGVLSSLLLALYMSIKKLQKKYASKKSWLKPQIKEAFVFLIIPVLLPILITLHVQYKIFQEKTVDKIATDTLNSIQHLQEAAMNNYQGYQSSFENLGISAENIPDDIKIYLTSASVPPELNQVFPPEVFPYVDKKSYQILLALKNPHSRTTKYFVGNEKYEIRQLKKQLPY